MSAFKGLEYQNTGSAVLRELKHGLDRIECCSCNQLTQKEFGELLGMQGARLMIATTVLSMRRSVIS
jgi:hypothetical protein